MIVLWWQGNALNAELNEREKQCLVGVGFPGFFIPLWSVVVVGGSAERGAAHAPAPFMWENVGTHQYHSLTSQTKILWLFREQLNFKEDCTIKHLL